MADPADMRDDAKTAAAPERSAPLLASRVDEERRIGVLAFNPTDSQWPMRVSFPLFVRNAALWLARPGGLRRAEALRTGDTIQMDLETPVTSGRVISPSGREFPAFVAAGGRSVSFSETHELGVYRVTAGDRPAELFAVSLLAAEETDNRMRDRMEVGGRDLAAVGESERNADLWPWLAFVALCLLILEWVIYNRRMLG